MRTIPVRDEIIPKETGCSKNLFFPIQHTRKGGGGVKFLMILDTVN